jgi:hypothetical protein
VAPDSKRPVARADDSRPASGRPALSDAFSALLAMEEGGPLPSSADAWVPVLPAALVEQLTARVTREVAERVIRELAPGLVSEIAQRLVRDEIARLKSGTTP